MSNPNTRKSCVVPKCTNTTVNAPEMLFFLVPMNVQMREKWIKAMRRSDSFGAKSKVYCCEDHFDIKTAMENYVKYKLVGGRIKLKEGTVPHKFKCQQENDNKPEKSAVRKRNQIRKFEKRFNEDQDPIAPTLDAKPEEIYFPHECHENETFEDPLSFENK